MNSSGLPIKPKDLESTSKGHTGLDGEGERGWISRPVPNLAVGFDGLKKRFHKQQAALAKQRNMVKHMKAKLENEKLSYKKNCECDFSDVMWGDCADRERLKSWNQQMGKTEAQLLNVFRRVEEGRMQLAAKQCAFSVR